LDLASGQLSIEAAMHYPYAHVAAVVMRTVPVYEWSPPSQPVRPGQAAPPPNGSQPVSVVSARQDFAVVSLEYSELQIMVTSGDRANVALGFVDQSSSRDFTSMLMPSGKDVKDAVNAALRRRDMHRPA
jgi:hypothetical protein